MILEGETEAIKSIQHSERIALVSAIQLTIPRDRVRVQKVQGKAAEMWGLVCLGELPFYFRTWPSVVKEKLEFLENGFKVETRWKFVHRPYPAGNFQPTVLTKGIGKDDEDYIRRILEQQSTGMSIGEMLRAREDEYRQFDQRYQNDFVLRRSFGVAVSIVCDEIEANL